MKACSLKITKLVFKEKSASEKALGVQVLKILFSTFLVKKEITLDKMERGNWPAGGAQQPRQLLLPP